MSFSSSFTPYSIPILERGVRLPDIKISNEDKARLGLGVDCTNSQYLRALAQAGLKERRSQGLVHQGTDEDYSNRLDIEFKVFEQTGTIDYILLLLDLIKWCKNNDVKTGVGRGSSGGSCALFCLGITEVDTLHYNLNFARFLSEARAKTKIIDGVLHVDGKSMCDVDVDLENLGRERLIKRMERDYGNKTCKISTVQYLTGKTALKDVLKLYGDYSEGEAKEISDKIDVIFGKVNPLKKEYENNLSFKKWADEHKELFDLSCQIEGLTRSYGIHASGMLVSYYEMDQLMPRELSSSDEIVSGYDMNDALALSVKVDVLGLRTLDLLKICEAETGVNCEDIDVNDPSIYDFIEKNNDYYGLFQIEEGATKEATKKVKPKNILHLSALVAISRPGALKYVDDFAKYVNTGEFNNVYPTVDEVLKDTGNIVLYQESIMEIVHKIYGFSNVDANEVRRAVGKKLREEMKPWEEKIYKAGKEKGIPENVTKWFWDICNASADYLFCQCLSPDTKVDILGKKNSLICDVIPGDFVRAFDTITKKDHYVKVLNQIVGEKVLYLVAFDNGTVLKCSMKHKLLCHDMTMRAMGEIFGKDLEVLAETPDKLSIQVVRILSVVRWGPTTVFDLTVDHPDHNFYANGIIVSNSHATAYAHTTAYTSFYKANYPTQFFLACLKTAKNEQDPMNCISTIKREMANFGIKLLPPDLIKSKEDYSIDDNKCIRTGISAIKGLSDKAMDKIKTFNRQATNKLELFESFEQAKLGIAIATPLILSGCVSNGGIKESRAKTQFDYEMYRETTEKEKIAMHKVCKDYNFDVVKTIRALATDLKDEKGNPFIKESRLNTLRKNLRDSFEKFKRNEVDQDITNWIMETTYLGFSHSTTLKDIYTKNGVIDLLTIPEALKKSNEDNVRIVTQLGEVEERISQKSKKTYIKLVLKDDFGTCTGMVFGDKKMYEVGRANGNKKLEEGQIVIINGNIANSGGNSIFINTLLIQDISTIIKKSELAEKSVKKA